MNQPHSDSAHLLDLLTPVLAAVASAGVRDTTDDATADEVRAALQCAVPFEGETIQAIGAALREGIAAGWLCHRGEEDARFSRIAKASDATAGLSIDIVALRGPALRHGHPAGEVTLAFPAGDGPAAGRFDGHPPGWVVMPAGSTHTPTVTGDPMHLLYFLPGGEVDWAPGPEA
jgi:hypothetical protein